jgi:hypothetical protein
MAKNELVKTGEVFVRDEQGNLCLVESFIDKNGVSSGSSTIVEYAEVVASEGSDVNTIIETTVE